MTNSPSTKSAEESTRFEKVAKHLAAELDAIGFRAKLTSPQRLTDPLAGWCLQVASLPGLPAVALYHGNFFKPDVKQFWIGFETMNAKKIEGLAKIFAKGRRQKVARYSINWSNYPDGFAKIADERPRYVEETDATGWAYFGQYQFDSWRSDHEVVIDGKAFIDEVVNAFISLKRPFPRSADKRTTREIMVRRGQQEFRKRLMTVYGSRCVISGCSVKELLEAAHIVPYSGKGNYELSNGLLLRSDLHNLFDLGLLRVDPQTMTVAISPTITDKGYRNFDGQSLKLPKNTKTRPSIKALRQSWLR